MPVNGTRQLDVAVVCFPYHSSKDTGRGHDRYIFELVENLKAHGNGVNVRLIDSGFAQGAFAAATKLTKLTADLLSQKADVYHAASPIGGASAALLRRKPLVVTVHDLIPFQLSGFDASWKSHYVRACVKICVAAADAIIVPLRVTKDELVARHGATESKIHVVNHGVDHSVYYVRPQIERAPRRILYIGEVSRSKGVDVLVRAFAQVKARVPDAELLIAGKTSADQPAIEELSRTLGTPDITFQGFVPEDELPTYYASATLMAFPSRYGFGLSTLEAMACGTPVVAAAALDAPEFIADAGLLAKPGDVEDLAENLARLLTDSMLQKELSRKGIERAAQFSWSNMAIQSRRVYDDALARVREGR